MSIRPLPSKGLLSTISFSGSGRMDYYLENNLLKSHIYAVDLYCMNPSLRSAAGLMPRSCGTRSLEIPGLRANSRPSPGSVPIALRSFGKHFDHEDSCHKPADVRPEGDSTGSLSGFCD